MKITYFAQTEGGCDYYRAMLPMKTLAEQGLADTKNRTPLSAYIDIENNPGAFEADMAADAFLVPRVLGGKGFLNRMLQYIGDYNQNGTIVFDYDDDMFSVSPLSPHYQDFGTEEAKVVIGDEVIFRWSHGENIDLDLNRERIEGAKQVLKIADLVTVTTEDLANVYRKYAKRVAVLPNCLDLKRWKPLPLPKSDKEIRLYWSGGSSHFEDLYLLKKVLPVVMEEHPQTKLVIQGWLPKGIEQIVPDGRFEYHGWEHTQAYPYKAATLNCDIGLIPLKDTPFNRGKSPIKWLEMAALRIPCVTSYVKPYAGLNEMSNEDNGIFVYGNEPSAWIDAINLLVENAAVRERMGHGARTTVLNHFDIEVRAKEWLNAYKSAKGEPAHADTAKSNA